MKTTKTKRLERWRAEHRKTDVPVQLYVDQGRNFARHVRNVRLIMRVGSVSVSVTGFNPRTKLVERAMRDAVTGEEFRR